MHTHLPAVIQSRVHDRFDFCNYLYYILVHLPALIHIYATSIASISTDYGHTRDTFLSSNGESKGALQMGKRKTKDIIIAAMLEMIAYAMEEGEDMEVPSCLRMLAKMLRK